MASEVVSEVQVVMEGDRHGFGFTIQEAGNHSNWMSVLYISREDADHARAVIMEALKTAISIKHI